MGLQAFVTPKELQRQCDAVFTGRNIKIWAVNDPRDLLTFDSTAVEWEAARVTVVIENTIGGGTYNKVRERYEMPPTVARFESGSQELQFNKIAVQVDDAPYLHSVQIEEPGILLPPENYRTYLVYLAQDDGPNEAIPIFKASEFGAFMLWGTHTQWHKTWPDSSPKVKPVSFRTTGFSSQWSKEFPYDSPKAQPGHFGLSGGEMLFDAPDAHNWLHAQRGQIWLTGQHAGYTITAAAPDYHLEAIVGMFETDGYESTGTVIEPAPPTTLFVYNETVSPPTGPHDYDAPGKAALFAPMGYIAFWFVDSNGLDARETEFFTNEAGTPFWFMLDEGPNAGQWVATTCRPEMPDHGMCAMVWEIPTEDFLFTDGGPTSVKFAFTDPSEEYPPEPPITVYEFDQFNYTVAGPDAADEPGEVGFMSRYVFLTNPVDRNGLDLRDSGKCTNTSNTPVWIRFDSGTVPGEWSANTYAVQDFEAAGAIMFNEGPELTYDEDITLMEITFDDPSDSGPPMIEGDPPVPDPEAPVLTDQTIYEWGEMVATNDDPPPQSMYDEQRKGCFVISTVGGSSTTQIWIAELDNHGVKLKDGLGIADPEDRLDRDVTIGPGSIWLSTDWLGYDLREFTYTELTFNDQFLPDDQNGWIQIHGLDAADGSGPFTSIGGDLQSDRTLYAALEPRLPAAPYEGMVIYCYHRFSDWPGGASDGLPPAAMLQDPGQAVWYGEYPSNGLCLAVQDGYGRTLGNLETDQQTGAMGGMISTDMGATWNYFWFSGGFGNYGGDFVFANSIYAMPNYEDTGIETAEGDYSQVEQLWIAVPSPDQLRTTKIDKRRRKPWQSK